MDLFYGEQAGNRLDWQLANNLVKDEVDVVIMTAMPEPETEVFLIVEEMPEFPGGTNALEKYIAENAIVPYSAIKEVTVGTVRLNFVIDNSGFVKNIRVLRSSNKLLDKAAVYLVSKMPKWKPGMQRGQPVNVSYNLSVSFLIPEGELSREYIDKAKQLEERLKGFKFNVETGFYRNNKEFDEIEEKVKKGKLDEVSASDIKRYVFSATRLGWLNCDRFYQSEVPLIDFNIPVKSTDNVLVTAIFKRMKAMVRGQKERDKIVYRNMPLGEEITIVAIKTEGENIYLAVQETLVANSDELVLDYKKVTMKLLKKKMKELNQSGF
ncbi:MAG: energy transducer TonB [Draconibacterium sp.]